MVTLERGPYFIGFFERGGSILLAIRERKHSFIELVWEEVGGFFIYVQNYAGGWLEFQLMVHAQAGGLVIWIKLFFRCGLSVNKLAKISKSFESK